MVSICKIGMDGVGNLTAVNTFGADGLVSRNTASVGSAFYTFDPSGGVAQRLDGGGAVLSSDLYDAFGQGQTTASAADAFGYGGQWAYYTDGETGLVLCTHRFYDPANGRWLTRDPMGYEGGFNLYAYCTEDPINDADPQGYRGKLRCFFGPSGGMGEFSCYIGGKKVLHCQANNRTTNEHGDPHKTGSNAPCPPGTYGPIGPVYWGPHSGPGARHPRNMAPIHVPNRPGICIHTSGQGQNFGWGPTDGCIKVTPDCMAQLLSLLKDNSGNVTVTN